MTPLQAQQLHAKTSKTSSPRAMHTILRIEADASPVLLRVLRGRSSECNPRSPPSKLIFGSLEPRRSFSASSQVAYGSLLEEGRRNEQSECEQRSTECEYYLLSINRMIECCSDTKAERQKPKLGCAERTSGGFRSRGGASVTKSRVTDGASRSKWQATSALG